VPTKSKDTNQLEVEALERARHLLRTTGLETAINSLIAVCADPKSPAPAKATAGVALMRANGLLNDKTERGGKPPSEMSPEELAEALADLKADLAARNSEREPEAADGEGGLFD